MAQKIFSLIVLGTLLIVPTSVPATSFAPMAMSQRVSNSNLIVVAKIMGLKCITPKNKTVKPGEACTGPGLKNRLKYEISSKEVLFYRPQISRAKNSEPPKEISFAFTAMSHWSVPEDQYKSLKGIEMIFLLREDHNGALMPIHEAFFQVPIDQKAEVERIIKKRLSELFRNQLAQPAVIV